MFAISFGLDAATRVALGLWRLSEETEPLVYLACLFTFGLIIVVIVHKNRPGSGSR